MRHTIPEKLTWDQFTKIPFADKLTSNEIKPGVLYRISHKGYHVFVAEEVEIIDEADVAD